MVKHDHNPAVLQVVRYGLPLVILIFYVSASWNFSYTPDSTYLSLRLARMIAAEGVLGTVPGHPCATPNPLWAYFVAVGTLLRVDGLLLAKIFSLFFSCLVVVLTYLLATEVLRDRFLAFCSALGVATSGLVLQVAPAGSALPLALTCVLAALFFMLRNDYLLAALMIGFASLLFWQAAGGFLLLLWDAWLNSTTPGRRVRVVLVTSLVYLATVLPWVLLAVLRSVPPLPWMVSLDDFPGLSPATGVATAIPALAAAAASVGILRREQVDGLTRQTHMIIVMWACWFAVCFAIWGWDFYLFVLPVVIIYAFSGTQQLSLSSRPASAYAQALFMGGVLILLHQLAFNNNVKPVMTQTEKDSEQLVELAYWIKNGVPDQDFVSANRPELLAYFAGRPIGLWEMGNRPSTEYVVSSEEDVWGYAVVHRASHLGEDGLLPGAGRFAVWKKR